MRDALLSLGGHTIWLRARAVFLVSRAWLLVRFPMTAERFVVAGVLIIGIAFAAYISGSGFTTLFIDQNAHLNLSREVFDSMTPGLSQIGFWPPLLHILLAPFAVFDSLYQSGLAAAFVLLPALAFAAFCIYRIVFLLTASRRLGFLGVAGFVLNPYVLYYAVTPMMETLFLSLLAGVAYAFLLWLEMPSLGRLVTLAVAVAFAGLARFEGLVLIPLVAGLVGARLLWLRRSRFEIESLLVLFLMPALVGLWFLLAYGWVYGLGPLEFVSGEWSAAVQQQDYMRPAAGSLAQSFVYLTDAAGYMLGKPQILIAIASFLVLMVALRGYPWARLVALASITLSPFLVNLFSLYAGTTVIYLPHLPPFEDFYNERYGLSLALFTAVFPPLLIEQYLAESRQRRVGSLVRGYGWFIAGTLIALHLLLFFYTVGEERFAILRNSARRYPSQIELAATFHAEYDGGQILITRSLHDFTLVRAGIPLRRYIHEANFPYYDQALERPWLFARWVVMINRDNPSYTEHQLRNERISARWWRSAEFERYYRLVGRNDGSLLYRLDETAVRDALRVSGLPDGAAPALRGSGRWDAVDAEELLKHLRRNTLRDAGARGMVGA